MIVKCKNCLPKEGMKIPEFNQLQKDKLVELTIQSPLQSTKLLIDTFNLNHLDAKYIVTHINRIYGKCNRCDFTKLDKEYIQCPKCGALNFNWKTDIETKI
jgi:hypothetical protein